MPRQGVSAVNMKVCSKGEVISGRCGWVGRLVEEVVLELKQENEMYHYVSGKLNGTCIFVPLLEI